MWLSVLVLVALCAIGNPEKNITQSGAGEEKLVIARGKVIDFGDELGKCTVFVCFNAVRESHNLEYSSGETKKPRLIFYNDKDEEVKIVPLKKMTSDEICDLLDSHGFYKRSQKGEDVPEEFRNFPLKAPRDEL
ncbi:Selenoprotein M [Bagarius yarrelli]|uniref:Selenoprotein M n=1 Tax=Bagarius yarrelli TaxID=175774 RepID=A0A556V4A7_BAGYA|nr:Selenoprotein M [Bagarius yarrelli]